VLKLENIVRNYEKIGKFGKKNGKMVEKNWKM